MPRYWVIAPAAANPRDAFVSVWQFDVLHNVISIGWEELGDVSGMSQQELLAAVAATYPDRPQATITLFANMIWAFFHEISVGDSIVARRGRRTLAALGTVTGSAVYAPGRNPAHAYPNFLDVSWHGQPRDKLFPTIVFPMQTVAPLSEERLRGLLDGVGTEVAAEEPVPTIEDPNAFVLEKYLEDFIVSNFAAIFRGELQIYVDPEGNDGQQYATDIGAIDILGFEAASRSFVVIELKKGRPSDQVVGQVLRYMGWVKKNLCTNGEGVKGLVVCRDPDDRLSYALEMVSQVAVRYYSVSFKLRETP